MNPIPTAVSAIGLALALDLVVDRVISRDTTCRTPRDVTRPMCSGPHLAGERRRGCDEVSDARSDRCS